MTSFGRRWPTAISIASSTSSARKWLAIDQPTILRRMMRERFDGARCTVDRLMRVMGLEGAIRGKTVRTTFSYKAAPCPLDRGNRQFHAPRPNVLGGSDFTHVSMWVGFVYVAFVLGT